MEEYIIPLKGLEAGTQEFKFLVDKTFIDCFENNEISDSSVWVNLSINKATQAFEMHFKLKGQIKVSCDRCLEDLDLKIKGEFNLYLKYGEVFEEVDDEVIIIPHDEGFFDLSQYVYEFLNLCIPISRVHEGSKCNPEMLAHLKNNNDNTTNETDPRWDVLRKIANNN